MDITRKSFMIGAGAALASTSLFGASKRTFRIGLVGCGGRGTGVWFNLAKGAEWLGCDAKLVACADFFADKAEELAKQTGAKVFGKVLPYAEAFEIGEYGRGPSERERKVLESIGFRFVGK